MICENCKTKNSNDAKFCKGCGQPLNAPVENKATENVEGTPAAETAKSEESAVKEAPKAAEAAAAPAKKAASKKEKGKGKFNASTFVGIAAVAILVALVCLIFGAGKSIKMNKYINFEATGYDGYGHVRANIDWNGVYDKYGEKLSFTKKAKKDFGTLIEYMTPVDMMRDYVSVEMETTKEASNGDKIAYTWDVDEKLYDYVKCKVKVKDGNYKVSGLTKISTFDAFAQLEVTFSGIAPNGMMELNYTGTDLSRYDFEYGVNSGLSNGDVVKVTINSNRVDYFAQTLGKVPATLEKEYVVSGLSSYITSISEVSEDALAAMQRQAQDVYNAQIAKNWSNEEKLESFTYLGNYLLTTKDASSWGNQNTLYLVYKVQVRDVYTYEEEVFNEVNDVYWYIAFSNVLVDNEGTLDVKLTNYNTPYDTVTVDSGLDSGWWSTRTWNYYGYETLDALYKKVVSSNVDSYYHEDNVDESLAAPTV